MIVVVKGRKSVDGKMWKNNEEKELTSHSKEIEKNRRIN